MRSFQKLADARYARPAAQFMRYVCYFVIFFHVLCLVLSLMGRQTFVLHTSQGTYDRAIYAEEDGASGAAPADGGEEVVK